MKKHLLLALLLFAFGARGFAQVPLTVADGSETNEFVPIYGLWADSYLRCQVVYPAADLAGMTGGTITALTFYLSSPASASWGSADFHVRLADNYSGTTISTYSTATMTEVYSGSLDGTQSTMTITFSTPFVYTGGNLLLEVTNETKGTWKSAQFFGIEATGASVQGYSGSSVDAITATQRNFIPKTTFTYTPGSGGPMCLDPTGLTSSVTASEATISWNAPTAGDSPQGYQVCCLPSTDVFDAATATWTAATGTSHTFTGLTSGTAYTAHVRSVCGTDFYSNGNASVEFTPGIFCAYTFDLNDSYGDGWNGEAGIEVSVNGSVLTTLTLSSGFVGTETVMLLDGGNIELTWNSGSWDGEISFTVTDPYGVQLYNCTNGSTLDDGDVFYSGTVSCAPITCFPPTGLHASVTSDEATIGWTEVSGNHLGYQAEWDESVLPGLSSNPFSFTGLSPASTHTVRVRTVCAAGDTSNWSAPYTFTTDCTPVTAFPYYEGFDNSTSIPACWKAIDGDGDGNNWFIIQDSEGEVIEGGESTSGNHYITSLSYDYNTYAALTPNNWLLSPPFTLPSPCNLSLVWYAKSQDPSYLEPLDILISTTGGDTAAFTTTVMSLNAVPGEYTQYVYSLANYAGQTVRFAFVHRNVTDQFRVNIDDVGVLEIPTVVTSDATNIDIYTASLNGSVTGQALTAVGFEWKASADSDYERDTVAIGNHTGSISFNLANLDPVTSYTFRTFAAVEGIIFYGDEKTFTTDQLPCPSPANLTVSNVDHESATVTWTSQLPTVGSYNVYLDNTLLNQTPVSALTYPLTGLNPGTSYEVRVVTVCEGTEGLFDTKTFSTPCIRVGCFAIGDTNSTSSYYWLPVNTYYNYSYTQQLFLASEMGSANLITNIAFKYAYSSPTTKLTNVKIYMGHTTKDVFASNTDTVPFADLTEVYSGNLNCSQGWNTFELDQPFSYNGTDNLVLALFDNVYGYDGNLYQFVCAPAGGDRALDYYSDSQVPDPANLSSYTGNKGKRSFRNVVKFGYCDNSTCVPPTVSVDNVTANDADVSWTPGYQESAWGMQYKGDNDNDWTTVTLTPNSANPYTLTNLAANTNYTVQMWSLCGNGELSDTAETTFTTLVSCPAPTSLAASNETADGATLTWTAIGTPVSFEVEYDEAANFTHGNGTSVIVPAVATTATQTTSLANLAPNRTYAVYVRAICGAGDTSTWSMTTFTTPCGTETMPWSENFDNWTSKSPCWSFLSGAFSGTPTVSSSAWGLNSSYGNYITISGKALTMNVFSTNNYWAVTPPINITSNTAMLNVDVAVAAWSSATTNYDANDTLAFAITTDNGTTYTTLQVFNNTELNALGNAYTTLSVPVSGYNGQTVRFAIFAGSAATGGDNRIVIDNVSVDEAPTCPAPAGVTVPNVTATTATLMWTPGGNENAWDIYVPSSSADVPVVNSDNMHSVTATSYTVSNLPSNSICTLYVRANCGNEESDWVSKTFTTPCGTVNIPYTEDFDSYSSSEYPTCWSRYPNTYSSSTNYPIINPNSAHSGSNSLYMYSYTSSYYMAILPELNLDGMSMSDLWVTFYYSFNGSSNSSNGKMIVGVMTNPADPTSFYPVDTVQHTAPTTWEFKKVHLTNYTGNGRYIAFRNLTTAASAGFFIDDVTVEPIPSCLAPGNLSVSEVTATSTTLTWTASGTETEWDLYVADVTVNPTDIPTANSNPTATIQNNPTHTLTGLTNAHTYKAYVRADCGNDGVSEWSNPVTFVPGSYNMGSVRTLTTCSATIYDDGGVDGNYGLNRNDTLTIYPATQGNLVQVSGTLVAESASYDYLIIYDGENVDSQHQLLKTTQTGSSTPFTIPVTTSTTGPLTLYFHADNLYSYAGFELNVTCVPPCEAPATVQATAISQGQSELTFGYDQQVQNINLELQYKATNATSWSSSILVQDNTYTLAGLDNNTTYDVRVRSVCGNADAPYYSQWVNGTISIACPTPMALTASDETVNSAALTWTTSGTPDGFDIEYGPVGFAHGQGTSTTVPVNATSTTQTTNLTNLSANTTYEVYVRAVCGNDHSDWSTVATFTTLCDAVTLPYIETFEDASNTRECWKLVASANIGGSNGMGFVTVDNRPTLRFSSFSSAPDYNQYGFSPLMNVSSNATNLKVKVTYATRVNDYLYFGYVTPTDTIWDPTAYNTNSTSSTYNWEIATFVIPANATQLAVHYYGNFEYYAWIDSVVITEMTGEYCYAVTNLVADSVTARTARISWVGNANTYTIINMADGSVVTTQADTTYKLTNLTPETQYTFGVVANCTSSNSDAVYVTFTTPISCPAPTGLTAEIVETDEIMFSVNGGGNAEGYQVEYGATGFAQGQGTVVYEQADATNPTLIVIDNLTTATAYDFYVRAICGVGDTSAWSPVTTESTTCDVVSTFPYTEDFDAVAIGTLPVCWTNTRVAGLNDWKVVTPTSNPSGAHSSSNAVQFKTSVRGNEATLQMPTFNLTSLATPMLSFWYTNKKWSGDQDTLKIYYKASPSDSWIQLVTYSDNVDSWTKDSVLLPNPSTTYQILFKGISRYGYGIHMDDIVVKEMPVTLCPAPTDVTVSNETYNSADVSWTDDANYTYELQYREANAGPQVDTTITAAAIANANGLNDGNNIGSGTIDANISYTGILNGGSNAPKYYTSGQNIRLYSNTSGNGNGGSIKLTPSNGAVITGLDITTSGSSYTPSVSYSVDGGTSATATLSGLVYTISGISAATSLEFQNTNTSSSNTQLRVTKMTIHYTLPGTDDAWTTIVPATSPTVLSNLDPETGYEVQVRTICAVGDTSDWSSVVPFSTEEFICGAPVKLSVNDITMNSAEVAWSDDGTYPTELQYMANGTPDQYVDNTFDFSQQGYTNAQSLDGVIVNLDNNITFVANKATGGTAPAYYTSGSALRIYGNNNFIVSAANGVVITGIEIDAVASYHPNINYVVDNGQSHSINGNMPYEIFNINAHTVTVTNPASTGNQLRMETLTVHYTIPGTAGTWTSMANVTSPVQLTGLMPNTNYSVRLRNICSASDTSVWTSTDFTTLSCPTAAADTFATACGSFTWYGTTYTATGDYQHTIQLANGCDSVVTLHLTIHNPVHASVTEEACDSYTWNNTEYTQSGTYTYSHQDANNCTQVDTLHLTVFHPTHVAYTESACGSYTWNNTEYTQSGTYTYSHPDANGCTQVDTLHLTIHNPTHMAYTESACGSYTWNNTEYTQSGTYTYSHQDANNCTQVDTLHLTIHPIPVVTVTGDAVIALYESATLTASGAITYVWNTGETAQTITVTPSSIGNHSYIVVGTSEFSCQSAPDTFVVEVGACRPGTSTETVTACDSFVWHGTTYTQSTGNAIYRIPNGSANGCDSVVTLHLTILNSVHNEITDANCVSYEWNGQTYTSSGDYTQTFTAANGCDSVVTLHLTIKQPVAVTIATVACGSYTWNNQTFSASGDYTQTFTAANGCDSVVTLHLTVNQPSATALAETACGSYTWNNQVYTTSGEYVQTFPAANGCDSVVTLNLTINPEYDQNVDLSICKAALPYSWRDTLFNVGTETGTFVFHRQTAAGCDSTVTLNLVVNDAIATEVTDTGCISYTWNNQVYTTSGDYVQTLQTSAGCDSTVTLHLTINNPVHQAFTEVACGSYTWNNTEYTASGDYTFAHTDANGCTQVDTLHLTIKPVPVVTITSDPALPIIEYGESATLTASGADSYIWNTQQTSPTITVVPRVTTSYYVVGTTDGCVGDTVNITVTVGACQLILNEISDAGCGSYNWNGTVYTTSGDYQQHLYNDLGCDSVVTLHLTIYPNQGETRTVDACDSYDWYQTTYTQSGTYTFSYYDGNGCIQTDTLHLTIHNPVNGALTVANCGPYMWHNTEYTQSGTYTYTYQNAYGCTLVDTLHLTVKPVPVVTVSSNNTQIVQHESTTLTASGATSYVWSNQATGASVTVTPMQTTTYSVVGTVNGCASEPDTITVYVTPCTPAEGVFTVTACDRYVWYGTTYTESTNTATHTIQRQGICDSIVTLHLTILHPVAEIIDITACESYTWHNTTFTQSGRYTYSHQDANGCTQVDTLHLTILRPTHTAVTVSECNAFVWHNIEYTQSGTYTFAHADVNGCTQVDTLHLTIFHPAHTAYNVDACESYVWNNTEYTQSGTYTYRHRDANGCQQIDTLHLTIHHPVAQSYEAVACESYTWNNTVYTQSGTYTYAHEDAHGCMQVDTLRLTIHNAVAESFEAEACESYTWNNTVYTQSGTYTFAHADANGCTQVDTLHLTVHHAVAEVFDITACESYLWNNTEYTQSGTYTFTHADAHGCTQVDTLHLIINNPTHAAMTESACGSYTWNGTEYTQSGVYTYAHADANGCTQVDTLHLTIFQPAATEFSANGCGSYYWNNVYYNESGDYVQHFQTVDGCDSAVTLHLTIYPRAEVAGIVGDTIIHEFESTTLTATALNGNPLWIGFGQTSSITVAPMTTTTYTVMAVGEHCASTPVRVTVHVLPCIPVQGVETVTACESYEWHGVTYTESTNEPTFTIERQGVCDSIVTLHLTILRPTHVAYTEGACGSYTWNNTEYTQSGTYTFAHVDDNGCTQVDTLHLTIYNPTHEAFTVSECNAYTWNNTVYTQSGTYTYAHADVHGCTQVDTLHLTIHNPVAETFEAVACGSYVWNNTEYTQSGDYTYAHTDVHGCMQVDTLHLTIYNPTHVAYTETACGSYTWNNIEYTQSGDYTYAHQDAHGCTQVDTLHLTILNAVHESFTASECNAYTWHNVEYTQSGTYTYIHSDANGCTKVDTLHLTIFHPQPNVYTLTTCGDYVWHGTVYTQTGVYTYTTTDINGCTQVDTLHLFVNRPQNTSSTVEACGSYVWRGNTYTQSGVYLKAVQDNFGCMYLDTLYLTIHQPLIQMIEATACESYTWNNVTYTQSGHYVQHFQSMFGCDSTVTLNLTVNHPQHQSVTVSECGPYTWHGTTYTQSGTYMYSHADAHGCTQVDTLHLIILRPMNRSFVITECESFTWGGTTYTQSGTYMYSHLDNYGCTQVDTLYLTINHPTGTSITVTECEMYDWNGFVYTQSGTYTQSHFDNNGCTQVDTLRLTIYHPVHQSVTVSDCYEYTWHGTTYNFSGVYTYTHLDNHGCTQVDTLHLTIYHPQSSKITVDACGSYQWYGTTYTQSGVYTHNATSTYGCQVVDTLILHIHQSVTTTLTETACSYYVWEGNVYTQSGTYVKHFFTPWGCDSVVTLHLDIHQPQSSEFTVTTENSCYTWNGIDYCQSGTYMQSFEDQYGCDSTVTLHLTLLVGISEFDDYAVSLYPNPTTGVTYVEVSGDEMESVEVYDAYGKLLQKMKVSGNVAQLELSAYATGTYYVRVTTTKGVVTKRVVKN